MIEPPAIITQINRAENEAGARGGWSCAQIAWAKYRDLLAVNLPSRFVAVLNLNHEILSVQTPTGEWLLDNLYPWPEPRVALVSVGYQMQFFPLETAQ